MFPFKLTYNCLNNEARHPYDKREDKIKRKVIWSLTVLFSAPVCITLGQVGS